ncbi:hypothetical protein ACHBTE_13320 [Streptomyces sp. M41]|uniref:hypothetical protein n=1 Tax=Streptomyces sp. M41 TaxID=3059412 RepID=UPI00374DE3DA
MTAENTGRDGHDEDNGHDEYNGYDGYEGGGGADALLAAITGEPLPDEARADAAFMAEHRAATADVTLLREQLVVIGDALAAPPPAPQPAPARPARARRRTLRLAYGSLAVAAAASVVAGMGWLVAQGGGDALDAGGSNDAAKSQADERTAFGSPDYLACAVVVAEGDVTSAEPLDDPGLVRVGVHVTVYYKGDEPRPTDVSYVVDAADTGDIAEGDRVLFGIPKDATAPDHWAVGEEQVALERAWLKTSLAESRGATCS